MPLFTDNPAAFTALVAELRNDPAGLGYLSMSAIDAFNALVTPAPAPTAERSANLSAAASAIAALESLGALGERALAELLASCAGEAPMTCRRDAVLGPCSYLTFMDFLDIHAEALR